MPPGSCQVAQRQPTTGWSGAEGIVPPAQRVTDAMGPSRAGPPQLDGIAGWLGHVLPSRRGGPPHLSAGKLLRVPPRVLFHPVVGPALRPAVTQARSATGLIRNVMLEIASGRGPPAPRSGAGASPRDHGPGPATGDRSPRRAGARS